MTTLNLTAQGFKVSSFSMPSGVEEFFITGTAPEGLAFRESLEELAEAYRATLFENGLDESTQQFVRVMLSDSFNEQERFLESSFFNLIKHGAFSIIEQRPLDGGPVGFVTCHIKSGSGAFLQKARNDAGHFRNRSVYTSGLNYSLLWSTGFTDSAAFDSQKQMTAIFS
ncbi:MAG: hypothetical protein JXA71_15595, partial [Chitinispirillaceae bacterium]|nr:hypothetical protein [Chitinispirillaceae bacterium]